VTFTGRININTPDDIVILIFYQGDDRWYLERWSVIVLPDVYEMPDDSRNGIIQQDDNARWWNHGYHQSNADTD
jgi:hypothetical protein